MPLPELGRTIHRRAPGAGNGSGTGPGSEEKADNAQSN